MNEKQRRARRRAAAREWKKESKGLEPFQRALLREMNRVYGKPPKPWLPLLSRLPGRATLKAKQDEWAAVAQARRGGGERLPFRPGQTALVKGLGLVTDELDPFA